MSLCDISSRLNICNDNNDNSNNLVSQQSPIHAKRTYREVRMLIHMNHENVIGLIDIFSPSPDFDHVSGTVDRFLIDWLIDCFIYHLKSI